MSVVVAETAALPQPAPAISPRLRVLLTAETLFAEHGIEAVSLRRIAIAAEHGNNNAVQYHFKSKMGLVQAIFMHRVAEMDEPRKALLAKAKAEGQLQDARTLLEMISLPHLTLRDASGKHPYAGFLAQYLIRYQTAGMEHAAYAPVPEASALRSILDLLEQRIAYVPPELARSRVALCHLMFVSMLVRADNHPTILADADGFARMIEDTLEIMVAAFVTPYRKLI